MRRASREIDSRDTTAFSLQAKHPLTSVSNDETPPPGAAAASVEMLGGGVVDGGPDVGGPAWSRRVPPSPAVRGSASTDRSELQTADVSRATLLRVSSGTISLAWDYEWSN